MPYACGSTPEVDDLVECVEPPSGERKAQQVGLTYLVRWVHPDGYVKIGSSDYISKASRFRLLQRKCGK